MNQINYRELQDAFNKITLRERAIIFAAVVFCSLMGSYFWIIEPAQLQNQKISRTVNTVQKEQKSLNKSIALAINKLKKDPLEEINNKIAFTQSTLTQLNKQLDDKLVKFIHAQKMPQALTKVLSKTPGVRILTLKSLPVETFKTSTKPETGAAQSLFYKHTLEITLQGDYNAIYQYLLNVEQLQDKFYWHALDYKVNHYPLGEVSIQIYTLSDQQDLVSG